MKDRSVLQKVAWGEKHFGSISTGRSLPVRDIRRCMDRGLVRSIGLVELCDDNGFLIVPSRFGEGYALTEAGRAALTVEGET